MSEKLTKIELAVVVVLWWMERVLRDAQITSVKFASITEMESTNAMTVYTNLITELNQTPGMDPYTKFASYMLEHLQQKMIKGETVEFNLTSGLSWPMLRFVQESKIRIRLKNIYMAVDFEKMTVKCMVKGQEEIIQIPTKELVTA